MIFDREAHFAAFHSRTSRWVFCSINMKYQLVIRKSTNSIEDFNDFLSSEENLLKLLEGEADVDGHDFRSGQANIFIITSQPETNFHKIVIEYSEKIDKEHMKIAYREL